jgi:cytochrome P450
VSQYVTHHSPALWKSPLEFRPDRFQDSSAARSASNGQTSYFPFGGGMYFCIGAQYAINEAKLMLATLLQKFTFKPALPGDISAVGMDASLTLRPQNPLYARVYLRKDTAPA